MSIHAVLPPAIKRGETLGIVAPAGPVNQAAFADGAALLSQHFGLRVAPAVHAPAALGSYLAASDAQRAAELNAMLADPDVRAIMMARGGYGIMRILPLLDAAALRNDPKPIIGFSDGTALLYWALHAGVGGIHGPVVQQLAKLPTDNLASLVTLLTSPTAPGRLPWPLQVTPDRSAAPALRGRMVGGNANLLAHLVGTPWHPNVGDVLFIEDVGEKPYAIDRYLTHLQLAGVLANKRAYVVGDFTRCMDPLPAVGEADDPSAALAVVGERAMQAAIPAWFGAPSGHGASNWPWPFGAHVELTQDGLTVLSAAVSA